MIRTARATAGATGFARGLATEVELRDGEPAHQIIAAAEEWGADLIVVGSKGLTGLDRFLLGSVAGNVARGPPAPGCRRRS